MEQYNKIEYLSNNDLKVFLKFIDSNWKKNHVFIKNIKIFEFQHKRKKGNYTFLISKSPKKKIESILGFIFCNKSKKSLWLAIWKTISKSGDGFRLLKKLISITDPDFIGAIGISEDAIKIYKILGWNVESADHYYLNLNYKGLRKNKLNFSYSKYELLSKIDRINIQDNTNYLPNKDLDYYIYRFNDHPSFKYIFIKLKEQNLLFIGRIIKYLGFKVLRIVDVIGDLNEVKFKESLLKYMVDFDIDLIEMVMFDSSKPKIDMFLKSKKEIIPIYTNPFKHKNIKIELSYKINKKLPVRFFLGDSDQDRPNS